MLYERRYILQLRAASYIFIIHKELMSLLIQRASHLRSFVKHY